MIVAGVGAAVWLVITGQALTVDGLFLVLTALLTAVVFGLYCMYAVRSAMAAKAEPAKPAAKAPAAAAAAKPAPAPVAQP